MTSPSEELHWDPETVRKNAYKAVDWVVDYLSGVESRRVYSDVEPGSIFGSLPAAPPEKGEDFDSILKDMDELVMPGLTHWQHPSWFAFFNANTSGPSLAADILSSGLAVQGMLWQTSPACTEVETRMMDWLLDLLGLPQEFHSSGAGGGVIQDTASSATLCALIAAREKVSGFAVDQDGV
ncbi:MAG: aspartate aminotransferase family protein, partial [Planctomycetes bacterium]|nr:aspartate aminotransferase family protein [Planctomycetota bacterium]